MPLSRTSIFPHRAFSNDVAILQQWLASGGCDDRRAIPVYRLRAACIICAAGQISEKSTPTVVPGLIF